MYLRTVRATYDPSACWEGTFPTASVALFVLPVDWLGPEAADLEVCLDEKARSLSSGAAVDDVADPKRGM
jgi:hypothetical protein